MVVAGAVGGFGIAEPVRPRWKLEDTAPELDSVVGSYLRAVLEAEQAVEGDVLPHRHVGLFR